ncbi:MAG: hypothetical protein ACLQDY_31585 [Streptosporangiaceae bacterium]
MLLSDLRDRTRRGFVEFAWRQWAQVGLSANVTGFDRWAIDPEALILFTIEVARRDPRLFDEVLDWLASNRRMLTMQRLRNLAARFPVDPDLVGAVVAWAEQPASSPRGPKNQRRQGRCPENVPLFSTDVLSFVGEHDAIFAEYGYIRPRVFRSGKSSEPDVRQPANFAFQLRNLFGPGSRSEVMRILLTCAEGPLDAARISDEAGFAKRNVSDTLAGLTASRVVKARWSGNERTFLAYRQKWAALLEVGPSAEYMPEFVSWVHLFPASLEIMGWLENETGTTDSEYLISSRARDLIERVTTDLEMVGLATSPGRPLHGAAYLSAFADTVESLLARMGAQQ